MLIRRKVLDKTGGFDESFFMYGEDIDLSYRITQAGFGNYYLGEVTIVHLKGRSTSKSSTEYIHHFYKAMHLFVDKHYTTSSSIQRSLLHIGILIRKRLALTGHFIKNFFNPG
jgi:GT2 family glycosyltransferase